MLRRTCATSSRSRLGADQASGCGLQRWRHDNTGDLARVSTRPVGARGGGTRGATRLPPALALRLCRDLGGRLGPHGSHRHRDRADRTRYSGARPEPAPCHDDRLGDRDDRPARARAARRRHRHRLHRPLRARPGAPFLGDDRTIRPATAGAARRAGRRDRRQTMPDDPPPRDGRAAADRYTDRALGDGSEGPGDRPRSVGRSDVDRTRRWLMGDVLRDGARHGARPGRGSPLTPGARRRRAVVGRHVPRHVGRRGPRVVGRDPRRR